MASYIKAAAQCDPKLLEKAQYNLSDATSTFLRDPSSSFLTRDPNVPPPPPLPPFCVYRSNHPELSVYEQLTIKRRIELADDIKDKKAFGFGRPGRHLVNEFEPIRGVEFSRQAILSNTPEAASSKRPDEASSSNSLPMLLMPVTSSLAHQPTVSPKRSLLGGNKQAQIKDHIASASTSAIANDNRANIMAQPKASAHSMSPFAKLLAQSAVTKVGSMKGEGGVSTFTSLVDQNKKVEFRSRVHIEDPAAVAAAAARKELRIARMDALHKGYREGILADCEPPKVAVKPFRTLPEPM